MLSYFFLGFLLALVYMVGCHSDSLAKPLLFHPTKFPEGDWKIAAGKHREVSFKNSKNETLVGWYYPHAAPVKGTILYCHGNGGNISNLDDFVSTLCRNLQCDVLTFDYAGYGKSEGTPDSTGILDDARAARDWLAKETGLPGDRIILYGQSLGGSVAIDIAAKDGARALIVESSFTSLGDMGRRIVPFLPVNWLLKQRLASIDKIGQYHGPVFISHGKADQTIPYSQGERLFKAANEPKIFYTPIPGYDYHSAYLSKEHLLKLNEFLDSLGPPETGRQP